MNHAKMWERALQETIIVRHRIANISSHESTKLPYIFLGKSVVNPETTVVRQGNVIVNKPSLLLPPNLPQIEGFELEQERMMVDYLLIRGIKFPSLKYKNKTNNLDVFEGDLNDAKNHYLNLLQRKEDTNTGLIIGPEDCWQYSTVAFVCMTASRSVEQDMQRLLKDLQDKFKDEGDL